jgi:hypothetical protein
MDIGKRRNRRGKRAKSEVHRKITNGGSFSDKEKTKMILTT